MCQNHCAKTVCQTCGNMNLNNTDRCLGTNRTLRSKMPGQHSTGHFFSHRLHAAWCTPCSLLVQDIMITFDAAHSKHPYESLFFILFLLCHNPYHTFHITRTLSSEGDDYITRTSIQNPMLAQADEQHCESLRTRWTKLHPSTMARGKKSTTVTPQEAVAEPPLKSRRVSSDGARGSGRGKSRAKFTTTL